MSTPGRPVERIHVFGHRMIDFVSDEVLATIGDRELVPLTDNDHLADCIGSIDVLFGFDMSGDHWADARELRLIQWMGAGVDKLLPARGLRDDVLISNASGTHEPQLPEWVIGALYTMNHQFPKLVEQQQRHAWRIAPSAPLPGKTLCVVGLGTIGQSIARRAAAIGMRVVGVRRSGQSVEGVDLVVTPDRRHEVLRGADAVVVITPLTDETRGLIGADELALLNDRAMLVDVSRGGVTDLDAVVAALESKALAGATIDVFETEPLPEESPLWDVERLLVTPHTSGWSPDYADRVFELLQRNVDALEAGTPLANLVERDRGY